MEPSASVTSISKICPACRAVYPKGVVHNCPLGGDASTAPASAADSDEMIGALLGDRYRIVSRLSRGGMGAIYKAEHVVLSKPLAIKIMLSSEDEAARQRFLQEAKLASLVHHPNIVDIADFGVLDSGQPYLVMELLVGKTLADVIDAGPVAPERASNIAAQIARGLHAVHQKGIIHRDLKPANIFVLTPEGGADLVKVVDFGIATVAEPTEGGRPASARLTVPGMVLGTAEYMSPEQAQGLKTDHRVDQYALGCILYEMLTGRVPHEGVTPAATMLKHITDKPVPPSKRRPSGVIPAALDQIVARSMEVEPAARFPSMKELEQELLTINSPPSGRAGPVTFTTMSAVARPFSLMTERQRRQLAVAAVLVFSLGVFALVIALRPSGKPGTADARGNPTTVTPPTPKQVKWRLVSDPSGAWVVRAADGKKLGETPLELQQEVGAGKLDIILSKEGYHRRTLQLSLEQDEDRQEMLRPNKSRSNTSTDSPVRHIKKGKPSKKKGGADDRVDFSKF